MQNIQDPRAFAIRRWSREELAALAVLLRSEPLRSIAEKLGRTELAIRNKAQKAHPELVVRHRKLFPNDWVSKRGAHHSWEWTDEDFRNTRDWYADRVPVKDIASRLGRTRSAVTAMLHRMGLKRGRGLPVPWAEINRLFDNGASLSQLMEQYHVSYPRLKKGLKSYVEKKPALNTEEIEFIHEKYLSGCSINCIASALRRNKKTISSVVTDHNLQRHAGEVLDDVLDLTAKLVAEGMPTRIIAEKIEVRLSVAVQLIRMVGDTESCEW